jgi:hypothetical protein
MSATGRFEPIAILKIAFDVWLLIDKNRNLGTRYGVWPRSARSSLSSKSVFAVTRL